MIYLSGSTNDVIEESLIAEGIGLMCQPGNSYHLRIDRYPYWAADVVGINATATAEEGLDWLAGLAPRRGRCLFATSPDAYPDAAESLRRGLEFAPAIRDMGFPVAVVAQDGAEALEWPWEEIDCLFVGGQQRVNGTLEWKESDAAEALCNRARNAGKWVHMGRVNSLRRLRRARAMGCLSVDGTYLAYGPNSNVVRLRRFLRALTCTPPLPLTRRETPGLALHRELAK